MSIDRGHRGWADLYELDDDVGPWRPAPGKVSRTSRLPPSVAPVQLAVLEGDAVGPAEDVQAIADHGVGDASGRLPFADVIAGGFGRHDIADVRVAVGGTAGDAADALGARAYATGTRIGFAREPDLHLAAHEAAHVVQQRAGVHLADNVGRADDPYERHADAVADAVVRGESAEPLLDRLGGGGGGGVQRAVQRLVQQADATAVGTLRRLIAQASAGERTAIGGELDRALGVSSMQVTIGLDFMFRGEQYRLSLPPAEARSIRAQLARAAAEPRATTRARGPGRSGARRGRAPAEGGGVGLSGGRTATLFEREFPTRWGNWSVEASVTAGVSGTARRGGAGGGSAEPDSAVTVNQGDDGPEVSIEHQGLIRDWLARDLTGMTDAFEIEADGDGLHFTAGVQSDTAHFGPFDIQFAFEAIRYEREEDGHGPYRFHAPRLVATINHAVEGLPIDAEVEVEIGWEPPWSRIGRWIAQRFGAQAASAGATGGGAAEGAVTAAELTEAGVATGGATTAVAVGVAVGSVLVGLAWIGGVLYTVAQAAEAGRQEGLQTWYVREFAVQFGDTLFQTFGQHAEGARAIRGASEMAGRGRRDARRAVAELSDADRQRLHAHGRVAVVQAVARNLADRLDVPFDHTRVR